MRSLDGLLEGPSAAADIMAERLNDSDLEIQRMAARYLGEMGARSAVSELLSVLSSTQEYALKATILQALGKIRDLRATEVAIKMLGDASPGIRAVAADVLYELADPTATDALLNIATNVHHIARVDAVTALGATLRGRTDKRVATRLLSIAAGTDDALAIASIEALADMSDPRTGPFLLEVISTRNSTRKLAAASALGSLHYKPAATALTALLLGETEKLAAAAAWSLGQLGDPASRPDLVRATHSSSQILVVNASASLALLATKKEAKALRPLLLQNNALARVNALAGLGRVGDRWAQASAEEMLKSDPSWLVRIAALRYLSMLRIGKEAIAMAIEKDDRREVRDAAKDLQRSPFLPKPRAHWAVFRIVDPLHDDRPVAGESRFVVAADGIATVTFSDIRGRIYLQSFPEGAYWQAPIGNLAGF